MLKVCWLFCAPGRFHPSSGGPPVPSLPAAGLPALFLAQLVPPFPTVDLPYWLSYCQYPIRVFGAINNRKANLDWLKTFFSRFVFNKHNFLAHKGEVQVLGGLQFCSTSGLMMFSLTCCFTPVTRLCQPQFGLHPTTGSLCGFRMAASSNQAYKLLAHILWERKWLPGVLLRTKRSFPKVSGRSLLVQN